MPEKPKQHTKKPSGDRLSLGALLVVLLTTNVWFFTEALTYVS